MGLQAGAVRGVQRTSPSPGVSLLYARATAVDSTFLFPPPVKRHLSTIQLWRQIHRLHINAATPNKRRFLDARDGTAHEKSPHM